MKSCTGRKNRFDKIAARAVVIAGMLLLPLLVRASQPLGIRLAFEPATLDWNAGDVPIHVINNVVEGLYRISPNGAIQADEATSLPKRDGSSWRIKLRSDLKWSDGKPVRAADYIASWTRLLAPKTASTYAYLLFELSGARDFNTRKTSSWHGARALGDLDIEISLQDEKAKTFPASILTHWASFPIRTDLMSKAGTRWGSHPEHMAFNGPYKISSYQHEAKIELTPNTNHRTPGRLGKIEALIIPDDTTALRLYENGRLQFMSDLSTLDRKNITTRPDYHRMKSPVLVYLGIDLRHPLLGQSSQRKALSLAIDRSLIPTLLGLSVTPTSSLTPATEHRQSLKPVDIGAAKRLLSAPVGTELVLGFFQKPLVRLLSEFLQSQWKTNLGLAVKLEGREIKAYWAELARTPFPVFINSYGPPVWDNRFYFNMLHSTSPMNLGHWKNTRYDQAVERGDLETAERLVDTQAPVIPLFFRAYDYLMSPKLKGAALNPMTSLDLKDAALEP